MRRGDVQIGNLRIQSLDGQIEVVLERPTHGVIDRESNRAPGGALLRSRRGLLDHGRNPGLRVILRGRRDGDSHQDE